MLLTANFQHIDLLVVGIPKSILIVYLSNYIDSTHLDFNRSMANGHSKFKITAKGSLVTIEKLFREISSTQQNSIGFKRMKMIEIEGIPKPNISFKNLAFPFLFIYISPKFSMLPSQVPKYVNTTDFVLKLGIV